MLGHRQGGAGHAQFRHHLGGRALDRLARNDRRDSNNRCRGRVKRVADTRQAQNGVNTNERVGGRDDHGPQIRVSQGGHEVALRLGHGDAIKDKPGDHRLAAIADEIMLKRQDAFCGLHHGPHRVIGHRHNAGGYAQFPGDGLGYSRQDFAFAQQTGA